MSKELNCKIVQDLMQSYLDEVTSEYTREQIEEHICHCKDCSEYCEKLKVYEKMRTEDAEYMRTWQKKVRKCVRISVASILVLSAVLLYLFIPRKITYIGTFRDLKGTEVVEETEAKITFSYMPGMELFHDEFVTRMNSKVIVQDMYGEELWQHDFKNWYYYIPTHDQWSFAHTTFSYFYEETIRQEFGYMFFDQDRENFLILAEYFEIEACTPVFRDEVEAVMNFSYD